jgi:EAL domain-containing protein (putative c-di-GMP-specific phosphodiesterase class I)/GGDEF domain-containing protein
MQKSVMTRTVKNITVLLLIFFSITALIFWLFFSDFRDKAFNNAKNSYELNVDKYTNKLENKIFLFDKYQISQYLDEIRNTNFIGNVKIKYKKFILNKENLIFQSKSFSDNSWNLANITVDVKFGEIRKIDGTSLFEFIPSNNFNINESLIVKYQLFKNNEIKNFVVPVDLNLINNSEIPKNEIKFNSIFEYFYNIKMDEVLVKELKIENINYATIEYISNDESLKKEIYDYFIKLIILSFISFLPIGLFIIFYSRYIENKYIIEPMRYLDTLVLNIVEHKFMNVDDKLFNGNNEYKNLLNNISKLSNKMASLVNELNINKETLERQLMTDNLTGLYDKKMFDLDMKSMFVSSSEGYIFLFKINNLNQIENTNGNLKTDDFILTCVNTINNIIYANENKDISFYRFQGSEFIILIKNFTYNEAIIFSDNIITSLTIDTSKEYKIAHNSFHIGATSIDKYGTIDSVVSLVYNACNEASLVGRNGFKIIEESEIKKDVEKAEEIVRGIVEKNIFDISFIFDCYSFDDELLIRELKPILIDEEGNDIPIGSFIAICVKINLNREFDEAVIMKVVEYIKNNNVKYKIAINLSTKTISDDKFIEFLNKLVAENKDATDNILFSITSYTASAYRIEFINFINELDKLGMKILIKRFKAKEYSLEELSELNIDYIKIDKELTQNIHNNLLKKHKIKNIIIFAEMNDVKIIVENVESEKDYKYLSRLDLYAVNR